MSRRRGPKGRRRRTKDLVGDEPERNSAPPCIPSRGANSGPSCDSRRRGPDGRWLPSDPQERFTARTRRVNGCLEWTGDLDKDGYGRFQVKVDGRWVTVAAHVWAWTQKHGPVPAGHTLDHVCHSRDDTCRGLGRLCPHRRCVDVDHLEPVTPAEQIRRTHARYLTSPDRKDHTMTLFTPNRHPLPDDWPTIPDGTTQNPLGSGLIIQLPSTNAASGFLGIYVTQYGELAISAEGGDCGRGSTAAEIVDVELGDGRFAHSSCERG